MPFAVLPIQSPVMPIGLTARFALNPSVEVSEFHRGLKAGDPRPEPDDSDPGMEPEQP